MAIVLPIALFSGLMPGGGLPVTVVVLSFVSFLDPWIALTIVVFHMAAGDITEPVPSILMGIPGARSAQATILDGYPMARQGLAGVALGASYTTTLVGGCIGALALLVSMPFVRDLLRLFGSAEFFLLALMGIMAVAIVSAGAIIKGMLTAAFGLAISMIGFSTISGEIRAHFGLEYLWDGLPLIPVVVGLFALPEAIDLVVGNQPIATKRIEAIMKDAQKDIYKGMRIAFDHKWLMVKSSLIGTFIGALPGLGGTAAHWIAYAYARQTEKGAKESFGKGDVRGVIAADAANNSVDGGVLIPTLFFGIPGSGGMAIFLAMLVLYGFQPGPAMLSTHLDMTMSFVITIAFANIIVVPIMLWCSPLIVKTSAIPPNVLAPVVISVVTLGAFQASSSMGDILATAIFGAIGIFMKRYGWPRPPILIAVVLAEPLEKYMWLSINTWGWSMLARPQFLIIFAFMIAFVAVSMWVHVQRGRTKREGVNLADAGQAAKIDTLTPDSIRPGYATSVDFSESLSGFVKKARFTSIHRRALSVEIAGEIVLLLLVGGFFVYVLVLSLDWSFSAALMPYIALITGTPFLVLRIFHVMRACFGLGAQTMTASQIMDIGFRIGNDPVNEYRRFVMIVVAIAVLYLGLWLIGFHIMLPLWTFLYMHFVGKTRLVWSVSVSLVLIAVIVGVYDYLIGAIWNEPLLLSLIS
jgi:TctA family transporter